MEQLTDQEIIRVFHLFYGVDIVGTESEKVVANTFFDDTAHQLMVDGKVKLPLTPLSMISDEDCAEIAAIASSWEDAAPLLAEDVSEWLEEVLSGNCATYADYVSGYQMLEIIDCLRSKGYALPYKGKSLFELGIAIEKPTNPSILKQ